MNSEILIEGVTYFTAADVAREAGVSRQTLWRWRQEGKVPSGRKYRDKQVLFTRSEVDRIRDYAQRLEPLEPAITAVPKEQTRLFGAKGGERR